MICSLSLKWVRRASISPSAKCSPSLTSRSYTTSLSSVPGYSCAMIHSSQMICMSRDLFRPISEVITSSFPCVGSDVYDRYRFSDSCRAAFLGELIDLEAPLVSFYLEYPTYAPPMPRVSRSSSPHLQFQPRAFRLSSPGLPGCKVSRLPEVNQVTARSGERTGQGRSRSPGSERWCPAPSPRRPPGFSAPCADSRCASSGHRTQRCSRERCSRACSVPSQPTVRLLW